ncbi:sugar ABC transporter ATP-binding protein [Aneurinibacillus tyrosinisolvens]|uniref:sugar ABC transporter ATP-binding protein n=1 Tax=Aneurinibacillus tyrosinisolvens TaxID=1443435 RepID=UPI00069A3F6C|nr:sugar ABC transporter ATP-binding protein [Aneurinibacillus tyrosinisolvens]
MENSTINIDDFTISNERAFVPPLLEMRNISKSYSGVKVLNNINLKINAGEVLTLVGENGAGKSTLIKTLAGVIQADSGEILIDGKPVKFNTPLDAEQHEIITVYQEFNLFPHLSIAENLFFNRYIKTRGMIEWGALRKEANKFLNELGLYLPVEKPVSTLSIAEKQMLEIAKAFHQKARVMILDEPTAVLGGEDVERLLKIVRMLRNRGVAIIFISHRLNEIFGLADRYVVLKDGEQTGQGLISETNPDDLVSKMVGREIRSTPTEALSRERSEELLRVEGLSRAGILNNINFTLYKGEILGIAGLRGAGRTELARAIFGADPIDSGAIFIKGQKVKIDSPKTAVKMGIGLVPEDRGGQGLFKNLSALQNISMVKMACSKINWIYSRRERNTAEDYVRELKIKVPYLEALVGGLSGGNQQKIVLAKWLEAGVFVLLLDEPTRGIDVGSKAQIYEVIRNLCKSGLSIIVISSELPEILEICNRILVMHKGQIAGELEREHATEEAIMKYAVGGTSHEE